MVDLRNFLRRLGDFLVNKWAPWDLLRLNLPDLVALNLLAALFLVFIFGIDTLHNSVARPLEAG